MSSLRNLFPAFSHYPHLTAIIHEGETLTFAALEALINTRCKQWYNKTFSCVAFASQSTLECILDLLAIWQLGGIAFPFNPRLPESFRREILHHEKANIDIPLSRAATFLCTSGSTATPKIAVHTWENYLSSANASIKALQLGPGDYWHLSLPLFHVSGLSIIFRCLISGAALVLGQEPLSSVATHFSLVPTHLFRILRDPHAKAFYKKARCLLVGGAPITTSLEVEALQAGLRLSTSWGMTETTAMATFNGRPLPHIQVSLSSENEIRVKGPSVFQGYWENGSITHPLEANGWFYTRDLGSFDPEGRLIWQGRKDYQFISGGENIQPEEIEQAIGRLPGIVAAIVVPITDAEFGSRPIAFIQTLTGFFDSRAMQDALVDYLPKFKIPLQFLPLPKIDSFKFKREDLRLAAEKWLKT